MTAEQPSVEAQKVREALNATREVSEWADANGYQTAASQFHHEHELALAALDSLTSRLERAERERDAAMKGWPESSNVQVGFCLREKRCLELQQAEARAQKAEQERDSLRDQCATHLAAWEGAHARAQKAERELAESDETHQGWINRTNAAEGRAQKAEAVVEAARASEEIARKAKVRQEGFTVDQVAERPAAPIHEAVHSFSVIRDRLRRALTAYDEPPTEQA